MTDWFPELINGLNIKRLAFDHARHHFRAIRPNIRNHLAKTMPWEPVPLQDMVEKYAHSKNPDRTGIPFKKPRNISDRAFEYVRPRLKSHDRIRQSPGRWKNICVEKRQRSMPFEIIVGAGPNGALPHAQPSDRTVAAHEPIVIDMGADF